MILNLMETLLVARAVQALNTLICVRSYQLIFCVNLALHQRLTVCRRKWRRPGLENRERLFWALLSRLRSDWRSVLGIVIPDTVNRWQKKRVRALWRRKSRPGRPRRHINFIRRISGDHPEYGEDRITLELEVKFGIKHSEATIRKYMAKARVPLQAQCRTSLHRFCPSCLTKRAA
jgi:hypothetical protein